MEQVSAVECRSYHIQEVYPAVKEAIDRIGFIFPPNQTVLLKPNIMAQNRPDQHTITHFSIVEALCQILKERNCQILIGESIAFYQTGLTREAFRTSGIEAVARKYGATLLPFEETPSVKVETDLGGLKALYIPEILLKCDMVINVCKLKTHGTLRLSGAVKNMFGCLPGGYKQKMHRWSRDESELADKMIAIHKIVKPALSIMDAVVSLDGGPTAIGRPVPTSTILASTNAAALDFVAAGLIGYKIDDLPILIRARQKGMIEDYDRIQLWGKIHTREFRRLIKGNLDRSLNKNGIFVKHTYVDLAVAQAKCTRCNQCWEACPAGAIKADHKRVYLNPEVCISCYYCLSICPEHAIRIKPSNLNRLIRVLGKMTGLL